MRVPNSVHERRHWVISQVADDFDLLDVWALPVVGGAEEFGAFLSVMATIDPAGSASPASRLLFAVRFRLGEWLGWDDGEARNIPGSPETSLVERLPTGLRATADDFPTIGEPGRTAAGGFVALYRTDDEAAAEISNATVHGVLHLSWVPVGDGRYRAHLAVYVKPRGVPGRLYLRFIDPFRHLVVYPALVRQIGRAWSQHRSSATRPAW